MTPSVTTASSHSKCTQSGADCTHTVLNASADTNPAADSAYGTFETVSAIDLPESESKGEAHVLKSLWHESDYYDDDDDGGRQQPCGVCAQDCCVFVAFLFSPIRLFTYKALLFHLANAAFAVVAVAWTTLEYVFQLLMRATLSSTWRARSRRLESQSFRRLLEIETALFNFISPWHERVTVCSLSPATNSFPQMSAVRFNTRVYFGVLKFIGCAIPGLLSTMLFIWSLQRLLLVSLCAFDSSCSVDVPSSLSSSPSSLSSFVSTAAANLFFNPDAVRFANAEPHRHLTTADRDYDILVTMAVIAVYAATMLVRTFAHVARHGTIYFCADHLLLRA